jgi:hypothetical protein
MYHGMMFSGCELSDILDSFRITTTCVFCAQAGNGKVLTMAVMAVEESYYVSDVGARVETQHTAPEGAMASLLTATR